MRLTILDMEKMETTVEGHGCRLGGMDAGWICLEGCGRVWKDKDDHRLAWMGKKGYGWASMGMKWLETAWKDMDGH